MSMGVWLATRLPRELVPEAPWGTRRHSGLSRFSGILVGLWVRCRFRQALGPSRCPAGSHGVVRGLVGVCFSPNSTASVHSQTQRPNCARFKCSATPSPAMENACPLVGTPLHFTSHSPSFPYSTPLSPPQFPSHEGKPCSPNPTEFC